jgi:hypothetical protein
MIMTGPIDCGCRSQETSQSRGKLKIFLEWRQGGKHMPVGGCPSRQQEQM